MAKIVANKIGTIMPWAIYNMYKIANKPTRKIVAFA
jgi:hypothetical protein